MSGFKVAVVGATGNVGREMLAILAERRFPVSEVVALASTRSIGTEVSFDGHNWLCSNGNCANCSWMSPIESRWSPWGSTSLCCCS